MEKLIEMLEEMNLPLAYDHFQEGESPDPPFICYLIPNADNFAADGKAYYKINEIHVELYTDEKNPELEKRVEDVFDSYDIFYAKSEVWIESEKMYEVLYQFEIPADWGEDS